MSRPRGRRSARHAAMPPHNDAARAPHGARLHNGYAPFVPSSHARRRAQTRWRVVFWVAIAVFVVAIAGLIAIGISYARGSASYEDLSRDAGPSLADSVTDASLTGLSVDWDALLAVNPDTVGWIYVPGTSISYPIVYSGDDERYLTEDFYGETNPLVSFGAIFLSGVNTADFSDANSVIYGHHLLNGAMFSPLADFADEVTFNEHRTAYLLTPAGSCRLVSFALLHVDSSDPIVQPSFATAADRAAYVQDKIDRSIVAVEGDLPAAEEIEQMFTLSTCDNLATDGRYVLCCYVAESTNPNVQAASAAKDAT